MVLLIPALVQPVAANPSPRVAASIQPLHSLLAGLVDEDNLLPVLLPATASPHSHALRLSEIRRLRTADVVFWIGPEMEQVLDRPLSTLPRTIRVVPLMPVVTDPDTADIGDPHLWLDPVLTAGIVRHMARVLADMDPDKAEVYQRRAARLSDRLVTLHDSLDERLTPVRDEPFITGHSAYGHLQARFKLNSLGVLTRSDDELPSAKRLHDLRTLIRDKNVRCIFTEAYYQPRSIAAIGRDTGTRTILLDPMGSDLAPGRDQYFDLMDRLADQMISCLGPQDR